MDEGLNDPAAGLPRKKQSLILKTERKRMIRNLYERYRELINYLIVGGLTTVVSFLSYWVFVDVFHIHYMVSTVLSWIVSVTFAYVTNRKWVFESHARGAGAVLKEMLGFYACRIASGIMEMGMMYVGVDLLHINDKGVKLAANVIVIIANYVLSKLIVFRKKSN